ncbi:MAG: hypothetical protein AAF739_00250 [Pseudomonadota bacterium]
MVHTTVIDGQNGRMAVYSGTPDAALEANPLSNLARIKFHSDLQYVGFERVTKTFTIPAMPVGGYARERINLGPHGRGFTPITIPVLIGWPNQNGVGQNIVLSGGVLLDYRTQRPDNSGVCRIRERKFGQTNNISGSSAAFQNNDQALFAGAGADATNLYLTYQQSVAASNQGGYPAFTLNIEFYVGNQPATGTGATPATDLINSTPNETRLSAGQGVSIQGTDGVFSSQNLHMRRTSTNPLSVAKNRAIHAKYQVSAQREYRWDRTLNYASNWRWDLSHENYNSNDGATLDPIVTLNTVYAEFNV